MLVEGLEGDALGLRVGGVVYEDAAAGDVARCPGLEVVVVSAGCGVDLLLRGAEAWSAGDCAWLVESSWQGGDIPVVELLVLLVGKMSETVPLRASLCIESDLQMAKSGPRFEPGLSVNGSTDHIVVDDSRVLINDLLLESHTAKKRRVDEVQGEAVCQQKYGQSA